jgi:hypothetical protein
LLETKLSVNKKNKESQLILDAPWILGFKLSFVTDSFQATLFAGDELRSIAVKSKIKTNYFNWSIDFFSYGRWLTGCGRVFLFSKNNVSFSSIKQRELMRLLKNRRRGKKLKGNAD